MQRNTTFVLRETPVIVKINQQNIKQQKYLQKLRESYKNKIMDTRRSYNSINHRRSVDLRIIKDTPSLQKIIFSRQMQCRDHQLSLGKIIKDLNLKAPDPKDKLYEYLRIPPPERNKQHITTIEFYIKDYVFIQAHPEEIHYLLCNNIVMKQGHLCEEYDIVLTDSPTRIHNQFKSKGFMIDLKEVVPHQNYLCLYRTKYKEIVERYSIDHYKEIQQFIKKLQLFNDVDSELMNKISRAAEIFFKYRGQTLYEVQNVADKVYIVLKGKMARKIIIEIQMSNMLPLEKQEILTTNTVYEVDIEFHQKDVLGYLQLLEDPPLTHRSQTVTASENSIIIGISYQLIKQLKPANLKWFKKERLQKYPKNYQQLCNHYEQKMIFNKKVKSMTKSTLKLPKQNVLALDNYKIDNIKYVRSNSLYKFRKSLY